MSRNTYRKTVFSCWSWGTGWTWKPWCSWRSLHSDLSWLAFLTLRKIKHHYLLFPFNEMRTIRWQLFLFTVRPHCPTDTENKTDTDTQNLMGTCVDICLCAVWTGPHNSTQPILHPSLHRSREKQSLTSWYQEHEPTQWIFAGLTGIVVPPSSSFMKPGGPGEPWN